MDSAQKLPLNDQQLEILRLFSRELDEEDLIEDIFNEEIAFSSTNDLLSSESI